MLVSSGHGLLLRAILGTLPSAVTHMSFGVNWMDGSTAIDPDALFRRQSMGFEVIRVPIQAAYDYLTPLQAALREDYQLVYKGELPLNRRLLFNEIGLWQGGYNTRYGDSDSKLLSTCDISGTNWKHIVFNTGDVPADAHLYTESLLQPQDYFNALRQEYYDNMVFKFAQPRIETTSIMLDNSVSHDWQYYTQHAYRLDLDLDLSSYNSQDVLRFAFTWVPTTQTFNDQTATITTSHNIDLIFTFSSGEQGQMTQVYDGLTFTTVWSGDKGTMRCYTVQSLQLGELINPGLGRLRSISISRTNIDGFDPASRLLLDGIRLDRMSFNNPLYGLVFYDQIFDETFDTDSVQYNLPLEKLSGYDGHIEHRVRLYANATGELTV